MPEALYALSARLSDGQEKTLADFQGKVLLIVNTASRCGFTPQYAALQRLYESHRDRGFEILAFPCDQFGHQEPGSDADILAFCKESFGITFPVFKKIEVNGPRAHPIFQYLKEKAPGWLGRSIKWNFTKFLVDRDGRVVERFAPSTPPRRIERRVHSLLAL